MRPEILLIALLDLLGENAARIINFWFGPFSDLHSFAERKDDSIMTTILKSSGKWKYFISDKIMEDDKTFGVIK